MNYELGDMIFILSAIATNFNKSIKLFIRL